MQDWIFITAAYLLFAFAAVLAARSLFCDRSRGRRRCPACWYDMAALAGLQCPECGRCAASERELRRTRRRWRHVSVALVLACVATASLLTPGIRRHGWTWAVPNAVLVVMPFDIESLTQPPSMLRGWRARVLHEIEERTREGRLAQWQMRILAARFERPRPPSALIPAGTTTVAYDVRALAPFIITYPGCCSMCGGCYPVPSDAMTDELAALVTSVIDMENWTYNGGTVNSIGAHQGFLFVRALPETHEHIAAFLDRLKTPDCPDRFAVAARTLEQLELAPLALSSPTTIADFAAALQRAVGVSVQLDHEALAARGVLVSERIRPLGPAPSALAALDDLGEFTTTPWLLHWDLDQSGIVITARDRHREHTSLVAYDFGAFGMTHIMDLARCEDFYDFAAWREEQMHEIGDLLRNLVDLEGWIENGGDTSQMWFYRDRILIRTTLANHAKIARLMDQLRAFQSARAN